MTLCIPFACQQAIADTVTGTFQVKIAIRASCTVSAGASSDIDFGANLASATNLQAQNSIKVNCSKGTPYYVGLSPSNGSIAGAGVMTETGGGVDTVAYQLRSGAGIAGAIWGNTATAVSVGNGVGGAGSGADQTIPVYATVASANSRPGSYADTVTVSVHY
ncbi:Csu type fimbrial protein [Variovorax paradoxus]|uniref:Csu type fimbrial protein n=1 Tax=Variovorax paradoxus TaxID=34073 RepID=UPI003D652C0C